MDKAKSSKTTKSSAIKNNSPFHPASPSPLHLATTVNYFSSKYFQSSSMNMWVCVRVRARMHTYSPSDHTAKQNGNVLYCSPLFFLLMVYFGDRSLIAHVHPYYSF